MHYIVVFKICVLSRAVMVINILQPKRGCAFRPFIQPYRAAFIVGFSQHPWERGNPICFPSCVCLNGDFSVMDNKPSIVCYRVWVVSADVHCSL